MILSYGAAPTPAPGQTMDQLADKTVELVESAYTSAGRKIALMTAGGLLTSQNQSWGVKGYKDLRPTIDTWKTKLRRWAKAGKRDDGSTYTWTSWFDWGKELARLASSYSGDIWDASPLLVVGRTISATASDTADCVRNPLKCAPKILPWWVWPIGAGAVGLFLYRTFGRRR